MNYAYPLSHEKASDSAPAGGSRAGSLPQESNYESRNPAHSPSVRSPGRGSPSNPEETSPEREHIAEALLALSIPSTYSSSRPVAVKVEPVTEDLSSGNEQHRNAVAGPGFTKFKEPYQPPHPISRPARSYTEEIPPPIMRDGVYYCPMPLCSQHGGYTTRKGYANHIQHSAAHASTWYCCPFPGCTRTFMFQSYLRNHLAGSHGSRDPFSSCEESGCGRVFLGIEHRIDLKRHHQEVHGPSSSSYGSQTQPLSSGPGFSRRPELPQERHQHQILLLRDHRVPSIPMPGLSSDREGEQYYPEGRRGSSPVGRDSREAEGRRSSLSVGREIPRPPSSVPSFPLRPEHPHERHQQQIQQLQHHRVPSIPVPRFPQGYEREQYYTEGWKGSVPVGREVEGRRSSFAMGREIPRPPSSGPSFPLRQEHPQERHQQSLQQLQHHRVPSLPVHHFPSSRGGEQYYAEERRSSLPVGREIPPERLQQLQQGVPIYSAPRPPPIQPRFTAPAQAKPPIVDNRESLYSSYYIDEEDEYDELDSDSEFETEEDGPSPDQRRMEPHVSPPSTHRPPRERYASPPPPPDDYHLRTIMIEDSEATWTAPGSPQTREYGEYVRMRQDDVPDPILKNGLYFCPMPECVDHQGFALKGSYARHVRYGRTHRNPCFECPEPSCGRTFTRPESLRRHRLDDHGAAPGTIACEEPGCSQTYYGERRDRRLWKHMREAHGTNATPIPCPFSGCPKTFIGVRGEHALERHLVDEHGSQPPPATCTEPGCGKIFTGRRAEVQLRDHRAKYHSLPNEATFSCQHPDCRRVYTTRYALLMHGQGKRHAVDGPARGIISVEYQYDT